MKEETLSLFVGISLRKRRRLLTVTLTFRLIPDEKAGTSPLFHLIVVITFKESGALQFIEYRKVSLTDRYFCRLSNKGLY